MAEKASKAAPKTFDVSKPGKSPASTTSKPVIVSNRPLLTDPMVKDDEGVKDVSAERPADSKLDTPPTKKVKLEPLSDPKPKADEAEPDDSEEDEPVVSDSIGDEDDQKSKAPNAEDEDLAAKREAERQTNLDKITLAKTYLLPINQVVRRRSRHVAVAGAVLILLLGLFWADVALDAGLISIPGVKAPTHFFDK